MIVKRLDSPYDAGRRGAAWVKVKPRHTLDLVVLAVEWGSGRRKGWLSNIHLGARDPEGGFVMLGKTFKGMTDEMLAWQTERFLSLETGRDGHVVHVRPEQVVEIAFDGVQSVDPLPRRRGAAVRPGAALPRRQDRRRGRPDRHRAYAPRRCSVRLTVARHRNRAGICSVRATTRVNRQLPFVHDNDVPVHDAAAECRCSGAPATPRAGDPRRHPHAVRRTWGAGRADRGHRERCRGQPGDHLPPLLRQGGAVRAHPGRLPRRPGRAPGRGQQPARPAQPPARADRACSSTSASSSPRSSTAR